MIQYRMYNIETKAVEADTSGSEHGCVVVFFSPLFMANRIRLPFFFLKTWPTFSITHRSLLEMFQAAWEPQPSPLGKAVKGSHLPPLAEV